MTRCRGPSTPTPRCSRSTSPRFWYRDWLFAIPACEIPKTGNFVTLQVGAYPVLVVRGADGQIRAFHNSCRHRGSRVCTALKGSARSSSAPTTSGPTSSTGGCSSPATWGRTSSRPTTASGPSPAGTPAAWSSSASPRTPPPSTASPRSRTAT
ncbi:Rieske 2Fe-2S domain-containing protein [Amaricoccus sp.]|uniref:Rieske 2Fe-2S domain-containing protein n=1 Tax=Amaricoccus sp. TaxID=1872485 RepID=UPI0039E627B7